MKNYAIILASGVGARTGLDIPKQFYKVAGKTILEHTIEIFEKHDKIEKIIIVGNEDYLDTCLGLVKKNNFSKVCEKILAGGKTRQESAYIGISAITEPDVNVIIHDAVRPFLNSKIIDDCIVALQNYKAVCVAIATTDTLIELNEDKTIKSIPNRAVFMRAQTPQCFELNTIKSAHKLAIQHQDYSSTDDCGLILKYSSEPVYVVNGDEFNIKITSGLDIAIADKLLDCKIKP